MLQEIVGLADEPPTKRRWFHDDYFDLFVWLTASGEVTRFQLCYGIHAQEQALVWYRQGGFFLDGYTDRRAEPIESVIAHFESAGPTLPKMIRRTVEARLHEFARNAREVPARRQEFRRAPWQRRLPAGERRSG